MPLFGFKPQFAAYVQEGSKTHTIRAHRKVSPKVGQVCHCYTGLRQRGPVIQKLPSGDVVRQKMARLLGRFPLIRVQEIEIWRRMGLGHACCPLAVFIDGVELSQEETHSFFWRDGFRGEDLHFTSTRQAAQFWRKSTFPWRGQLIHWTYEVSKCA